MEEHDTRGLGESGQILPLIALVVAFTGLAGFAITRATLAVSARTAASTAADATALAAAAGGEREAHAVAAANEAHVVRIDRVGTDRRATVERRGVSATARARASAPRDLAATPAAGLTPALRAAIARAEQLLGHSLPITSGHRTPTDQLRLWQRRASNPFPVAAPGTSMHERGLAIDVSAGFAERLATVGRFAGLCRPYPNTDPVHFELCR